MINDRKVDISVIIPSKNEEIYIEKCIRSVIDALNNLGTYEIILVDNQSEDNTVSIAEKYECKIIESNKRGAGSSRNAGVNAALGELVAFIDADCIVDRNWFAYLMEHLRKDRVAAAGTKIIPDPESSTWVSRALFQINNRRGTAITDNTVKVEWLGTSNMLIKKSAFQEAGGFNERLITAEDYDLSRRLSSIGDIVLDKRIYTIHLRESGTLWQLFCRELWRGQDSLKHWIMNGYSWREAPSIFIPVAFLVSIISGLITTIFSLRIKFVLLSLAIFFPLLTIILKSGKALLNPLLFLQCLAVECSYLAARGIAFVKEISFVFKGIAIKD